MASRILPILLAVALVPRAAQGQGVPSGGSGPRAIEVDVVASDAGIAVSADDALRLGLAPDGGTAEVTPPALLADSVAAWPEGVSAQGAQVTLELLVDEQGQVADAKVAEAPEEARFAEAALAAAKGLRFTPASVAGKPVSVRMPFVYKFEHAPAEEAAAGAEPPAATIAGEVRARGTRRPVAQAVLLVDDDPEPAATTDAEGRFSLRLAPGAHRLQIRAPGCVAQTFAETVQAGQALQVVYRLAPTAVAPYETIVRADRPRTELARVTLQAQELREVAGTQGDPFRVVMLLPGVASLASGVSYPVVRGSQPAATGFFLDGVRIPMLYHLVLGPAVVHPDFIDSIDFFPGAPPVQYGRLLGGAVEGHLSRPREDRLHATAYADFINAGAFVEAPFNDLGLSVTAAGRVSYMGLLLSGVANAFGIAPDDGEARAGFWDYQARVEKKVGAGRLRLLALGSSDDLGLKPKPVQSARTGGGLSTVFHRVDLRGTYPWAGGEAELGVTGGFDEVGLVGDEVQEVGDGKTLEVVRVGTYKMQQYVVGARAGARHRLGKALELRIGADVEHRRAAVTLEGTGRPPGWRPGEPDDPLKNPASISTFSGGWLEGIWRPAEAWKVSLGVRADAYHLVPGLTYGSFEPRLDVRGDVVRDVTLRVGAGLYHQPPTVLLHLPVLDGPSLRYGLQEGAQLGVGADWRVVEWLELSADAFYNPLLRAVELDLQQVVENRRRGGTGGDLSASGYAWGFELMARHKIGQQWFGWVSYSFLQSRRHVVFERYGDDNDVVSTGEADLPFAFEQEHVVNAALGYKWGSGYSVGVVLHFNTGRPESGQITSQTQRSVTDPQGQWIWVRVDQDKVERLPAFFRADLRAAKTWALQEATLELSLDILNVSFQSETYAYDYTYDPMTGQPQRKAVSVPIVLPMLGLKGSY